MKKPRSCDEGLFRENRNRIQNVLAAGKHALFLKRSLIKYPFKAGWVILSIWIIPFVAIYQTYAPQYREAFHASFVEPYLIGFLKNMMPPSLGWLITENTTLFGYPITIEGISAVVGSTLLLYVLGFITYSVMRLRIKDLDLEEYKKITGEDPSTKW